MWTWKHPAAHYRMLFAGKSEARSLGGLATPLVDGMEISILPAISGG